MAMDSRNLAVSIVICTWNRCALLARTLEEMTKLSVPVGLAWEILVVNNNSTDQTEAVIQAFSSRLPLRSCFEPTPGKSHACNRALREARGKWILWTDDDVLVDRKWLTEFCGTAERAPDAAAIGGPILPWFPVSPDELLVRVFPALCNGFCGIDHGRAERILENEDIYGANMAFQLSKIGGLQFQHALGPNGASHKTGDDLDFIDRIRQGSGIVVWSPEMRVQHYIDPSRMTVPYLAKYYRDWARQELRRSRKPVMQSGAVLAGAPRWLWKSTIVSFLRWQATRLFGSRERALLRLREHAVFKGWLLESRLLAREGAFRSP